MTVLGHMLVWLWLTVAATADVTASQPEDRANLSDEQIRSLATQLNHRSYKVREAATVELSRLDFAQIDRLIPVYKSVAAPEARMRLRVIAYNIFVAGKRAGLMPEGFIGITHIQSFAVDAQGRQIVRVEVNGIMPDSPAAKADIKIDDAIIALNGQPIRQEVGEAFADQVRKLKPGDRVKLTVVRDDKKKEVTVTLGNRSKARVPDDTPVEWENQFLDFWRTRFDPQDVAAKAGNFGVGDPLNGVIIQQGNVQGGLIILNP
ncbi:MAG: PDZ domain-containing protein [Phycisphaerae bacterium]|nr:PDZ domain-containing protein [Phycisphaerae bacterium]